MLECPFIAYMRESFQLLFAYLAGILIFVLFLLSYLYIISLLRTYDDRSLPSITKWTCLFILLAPLMLLPLSSIDAQIDEYGYLPFFLNTVLPLVVLIVPYLVLGILPEYEKAIKRTDDEGEKGRIINPERSIAEKRYSYDLARSVSISTTFLTIVSFVSACLTLMSEEGISSQVTHGFALIDLASAAVTVMTVFLQHERA